MNILVLHRNNVPLCLRSNTSFWKDNGVNLTSQPFVLPPTDIPDFDTFTNDELNKLDISKYDLFVLPYDLSESYMEYTGLRVAAHIRLTPQWNSLSTPILFLGVDKRDDIVCVSELGGILYSYQIFISSRTSESELLKWFKGINDKFPKGKWTNDEIVNQSQYRSLLLRLKGIQPPANYSTHHSIANEWAIMRWNDMMTQPIKLSNTDFEKMLYYKYLRANYGNSQQMKKWRKEHPNIEKIDNLEPGKKLVLIDDEWNKGWYLLLNHIAESSGFILLPPCKIKKEWDRKQLIEEVKKYVDAKENDADCYLLDLRLHDTDFDEEFLKKTKSRLSGFDILDQIKVKNRANPVIIFSASNKVWNFKSAVWNYKDPKTLEDIEGAFDYVLKETPESVLKPDQSYELYRAFVNSIRISFKLSELKKVEEKQRELLKLCSDVEPLNEFIKLVLLDRGNNKDSMLKACLMNLMTFLEDYIKKRFCFIVTGKDEAKRIQLVPTDKGGKTIMENVEKHIFVRKQEKGDSRHYDIIDSYYSTEPSEPANYFDSVSEKGEMGLLLSALYLKYRMNSQIIKDYFLPMKNKRNEISHQSNGISLIYKELYDFYFKIIVPVIESDHKKE